MSTSHSNGKTVLVTGAGTGFGRLTVEKLAAAGYHVIATLREVAGRNAATAGQLRDAARSNGHSVEVVEMDVTSDASVEAAIKDVLARHGSLDFVVNNAGLGNFGFTDTFTAEQARRVFDVNVFGPLRVNRAVLPSMLARGEGLIVHISSSLARIVIPCMNIYAASKAALESIVESMRYELAPTGVDVALIQPGAFGTDFFAHYLPAAEPERAQAYGAAAKLPEQLAAGLGQMLSSPNAPSPSLVAEAVQKVIETPTGQRPLRTLVDPMTGQLIAAINGAIEPLQHQLMQGMGLAGLVQAMPKKSS